MTAELVKHFKRVIVCGGRNFAATNMDERDFVHNTLNLLDAQHGPFEVIIHGCATGADQEGRNWATGMGRKELPFRPDWNAHGRAAGPMRNQRMLDAGRPDLVIAFPGGRGTADMLRRADAAGVPTVVRALSKEGDHG